jgi:chaperonin GroEL
MLEDIAILTHGKAITEDLGIKLENIRIEDLGQANKVVIDKDNTTIIEGRGKSSDIAGRIKQIRNQIAETTSDYDREKLEERLAKMSGGVAVVRVGAPTESEMKELKARVEDAMNATKAAALEGIVAGGGVALLRAIPAVKKLNIAGDERIGADIVVRALEEPMRLIIENGGQEGSVIVSKVINEPTNVGYNAETEKIEDLIKAGIIDPTMVVRTAMQNAASLAGILLTTEALITEAPKKKEPAPPPSHMDEDY